MFPGIGNRLQNDITERYLDKILKGDETRLKKVKINVEAPTHRSSLVFLGASILSDLMTNKTDFWISREDYEEIGPAKAFANCRI